MPDKKSKNNLSKILSINVEKINDDIKKSIDNQLYFDNYSQFCNYLELPIVHGNQKTSQLKNLHKILDFDLINKDTKKTANIAFIIKQAFYPVTTYDKKDLQKLTQFTLLAYLLYSHKCKKLNYKNSNFDLNNGFFKCTVSMSYLSEMLGYITLKYKHFSTHPKELAKKTDIELNTIYEFFDKCRDLYTRNINNSLTTLENYKFLAFTNKFYGIEYVISNSGHESTSYTDFGDKEITFIPDFETDCRELTDDEISKVLKIEQDSFFEAINFDDKKEDRDTFLNYLSSQNISMLYYLFSHRLDKKYYAIRHKKLVEQLNLAAVYKTYDIIYNYDSILSNFKYTFSHVDDDDLIKLFYDASSLIVQQSSIRLLDNTKKRHDREIEQQLNINPESDKVQLIKQETKEFKQLLDLLIYQEKDAQQPFNNYSENPVSQDDFNKHFESIINDLKEKNKSKSKKKK